MARKRPRRQAVTTTPKQALQRWLRCWVANLQRVLAAQVGLAVVAARESRQQKKDD